MKPSIDHLLLAISITLLVMNCLGAYFTIQRSHARRTAGNKRFAVAVRFAVLHHWQPRDFVSDLPARIIVKLALRASPRLHKQAKQYFEDYMAGKRDPKGD